MKKTNTLTIILILICLVFVLGNKSNRENLKWEYSSYWRMNMKNGQNVWKTPQISVSSRGLVELCNKLNITIDTDNPSIHVLFNYAGLQGWEFVAINEHKDETIYWFKRAKLN